MMNSLKLFVSALGIATFFSGCSQSKNAELLQNEVTATTKENITLNEAWVLEGLDSPESVIPSAGKDFLYVTNVNGEGGGKDENGYISTVSLDGTFIDKNWVSGLDAPKGMALEGDTIYVSDINRLVLINVKTAEIEKVVTIEGAGFLNDVAATPIGILVSDSANAKIYQYYNGEVSVWLESPRLDGVNGLMNVDGALIVTTMTEGELLSVDWETQDVTVIAKNMKNADGVALLNGGGYVVSSWPGQLHYVSSNKTIKTIMDTSEVPIFWNDFYLLDDALYVPNWVPGTLRKYEISTSD